MWPCLLAVRNLLPWPLDNQAGLCPFSRAPCPWALLRLMQSPDHTARPRPSALLAAPPDLGLSREAGSLPGHGEPVRALAGGGLARVQGWTEAGLTSPILPLPELPQSSPLAGTPGLWALRLELKLDPTPHVGYQGRLRSRPGCSRCPLPGGLGVLWVLVLSHSAAVPYAGSSVPSSPTPSSWSCILGLGSYHGAHTEDPAPRPVPQPPAQLASSPVPSPGSIWPDWISFPAWLLPCQP